MQPCLLLFPERKWNCNDYSFCTVLQELYPVTISDKKAEEVLASCSSIDTMDETAKEAYASFASGALAVDDSCKTANQRITRGQALLIADKLADYQMNYLADHAQTQIAEVRQIPGKTEQSHCQLCPIRHLIKSGVIA